MVLTVMAKQSDVNQNILILAVTRGPQQRQKTMKDFWKPMIKEG